MMELDTVSLEVMSRKLAAITDEMYFAVQRAARSSYVKEAADFATALLDPGGEYSPIRLRPLSRF
jgi:N-methylhydantoinase B